MGCGVHHDDAFNFRGNNTLHIVKVLVAFLVNDGIAVENQIVVSVQNRFMLTFCKKIKEFLSIIYNTENSIKTLLFKIIESFSIIIHVAKYARNFSQYITLGILLSKKYISIEIF